MFQKSPRPVRTSAGSFLRGVFRRRGERSESRSDHDVLEVVTPDSSSHGKSSTQIDDHWREGQLENAYGIRPEGNNETTGDTQSMTAGRGSDSTTAFLGKDYQMDRGKAEVQTSTESDEERQIRIERLVCNALDDQKGPEPLSLLQDRVDGQLAMDESWKLLFESSMSHNDIDSNSHRREILKRLLLDLIIRFGSLPTGPVFTVATQACPDPSQHQQDRKPVPSIEEPNREVSARTKTFVAEALQQEHVNDPLIALPEGVNGRDVMDESWNMLTSGDLLDHERDRLRRLCLKLVIGLNAVPAAMELHDVQFEESDLLGTGSFADVFRGRSRGIVVAVKRLREFIKMTDTQRQDMLKSLYREAFLWKLLDHQFILPLFGVSATGQREGMVTLVSPLATNGGIRDYIRKLQSQGELPNPGLEFTKRICHLLHQVSVGLVYLHEQGIVHGDLHCGNILINAVGDVQLTDFGLALIANATSYNYASAHGGGALFTRAPELLDPKAENTRQTTACDVYAFAFVCLELFTGERAFPEIPEIQILGSILKGNRPSRPAQLGDNATHDLMWSLITASWGTLPGWRPLASRVRSVMGNVIECTNGETPALSFQEIWRLDLPGHSNPNFKPALAFFHDYFVCAWEDGTMGIYSVSTKELLHTLRGHEKLVGRVAGTKRALVSASRDGTIRIWSLLSGKCLHVFRSGHCWGLTITNPETVDIEYEDLEARESAKSPQIVYLLSGHIVVVTFPPLLHRLGGSEFEELVPAEESPCVHHRLNCGSEDGLLLIAQRNIAVMFSMASLTCWDIVTGEKRWTRAVRTQLAVNVTNAFLDLSRGVVVASFGSSGCVWNAHTGEILYTLEPDYVNDTRCQLSGPSLLTFTNDSSLVLWDPSSSATMLPLLLPKAPSRRSILYAHSNRWLLWADSGEVHVVDLSSGLTVGTLMVGGDSSVEGLYLGGQFFAAALSTPIKPTNGKNHHIVMWRLGDSNAGSGSGVTAWNASNQYLSCVLYHHSDPR